jgi:hypothetical protein
MNDRNNRRCVICNKITTFSCVKCKRVYYCNKECQKLDKNHKLICVIEPKNFVQKMIELHQGNNCCSSAYPIKTSLCYKYSINLLYGSHIFNNSLVNIKSGLENDNCLICNEKISVFNGVDKNTLYDNIFIYFTICKKCHDLKICHLEWILSKECYKNKIYLKWVTDTFIFIPKEVIHLIMNMINDICNCNKTC